MAETSLPTDPFLRRTAIIAAAVAFAAVAIGVAAYFLLRSDVAPDFTAQIRLVEPTDATRGPADQWTCPEGRGATPVESSFVGDTPAAPADRNAFGVGQTVVYSVTITAGETAPTEGRWDLTWSDEFDQAEGVVCAFVVADDPFTSEAGEGADASAAWFRSAGETPRGQLAITGLEPFEQVAVQLWVVLLNTDNDIAQLEVSLTAAPGTRTDSVARTDRISYALRTGEALDPVINIDDQDGVDPGNSGTVTYTFTNPNDVVMNQAELVVELAGEAQVTTATAEDTVGGPTLCTLTDTGGFVCDFLFLNPGETVVVNTDVSYSPTAVSFWTTDEGECERSNDQDVCILANYSWLAAFSRQATKVSEAVNLADNVSVGVEVLADVDTVYATGTVPITIRALTDEPGGIVVTQASATGCTEAVYVEGDNGDERLAPGESWIYTCNARYDEGITEAEIFGETTDGLPVRGSATISFTVINPLLQIESSPNGDRLDLVLTNIGDDPIVRIAVTADDCSPRLDDNADGDQVLQAEEVWRYSCPAEASNGVAFGLDSLGRTVNAITADLAESSTSTTG